MNAFLRTGAHARATAPAAVSRRAGTGHAKRAWRLAHRRPATPGCARRSRRVSGTQRM